ncbi:MAG: HPr family phosphocarrier protein [Betaproteobacteria bacterium]|jgi:phosphocarrier protein|nr:HPr family phosphocarrier protein [Betaproteobacteria bacterium]MBT5671036.1 HPr family phosphocarrier protein [Betaproteobacteria bacterium]MBT6183627.1 HPr family phosphocarrier protein [Betaproteobacteria bacterium]MBT6530326.1 HPr family phosphocarrier protein [Betaproteobacteria bacterium]MBT7426543.1 HPr family phosphocarrier protein [Betaproteobacteria bacterium]
MIKEKIQILNNLGLHARASAKLTQLASQYQSEIWISRDEKRVNAKSIMGVMMLAAAKNVFLDIEINGSDEEEALAAIKSLILDFFGEGQ